MEQVSGNLALLPPSDGPSLCEPVDRLGPLEVLRTDDAAMATAFLDRLPGAKDIHHAFVLVVQGACCSQHYGHEAALEAGDFVLLNAGEPFDLRFGERAQALVLRVCARTLRLYLPSPEQFCGRPLRSADGISDDVGQLLRSVLDRLDERLTEDFRSRIGRTLLDTLATAFSLGFAGALQGSPIVCSRNARVRLHIERNLRDPELKPTTIAARMRMSSRYLRLIFAASDETVSAYILRRRLEECARELADPRLADRSITQIAFGWGFNSGPHFTRSFRNRFALSPREYRRAAVGA